MRSGFLLLPLLLAAGVPLVADLGSGLLRRRVGDVVDDGGGLQALGGQPRDRPERVRPVVARTDESDDVRQPPVAHPTTGDLRQPLGGSLHELAAVEEVGAGLLGRPDLVCVVAGDHGSDATPDYSTVTDLARLRG